MAIVIPKAAGMKVGVIKSGSMEPAISTGSYIYIKQYEPTKLKEKDIIAFISGKAVVAHRVVSIDQENKTIITKGDGNRTEDISPVPFENVIGKVVYHIPLLGYFVGWMQENWMMAMVGVLMILIISKMVRWEFQK